MALEGRQDELRELLHQERAPAPLVHPKLAEVYRREVTELHKALENEETNPEAMELMRSLVDEIVLTPEDGEPRVDLKGKLAGILGRCADSNNSSPGRWPCISPFEPVATTPKWRIF